MAHTARFLRYVRLAGECSLAVRTAGAFFDPAPLPLNIFVAGRRPALRTVKEYNEKVEYLHLNPVQAGLVGRVQDWRWSSAKEYSGVSAA